MFNEIEVEDSKVISEFERSAFRSHFIACWIGIVLNLLWALSDYVVFPERFAGFFTWRLLVSAIALTTLIFRERMKISIYDVVFVIAAGISVQNAFMWSVMDEVHMKQHTFAYLALFIGVGMLLLWEIRYSLVLLGLTVISNLFFFYFFQGQLSLNSFLIDGGLLVFTVAIFSVFLIRSRRRMTISEISSRLALQKSKDLIQQEHEVVVSQKIEIENQKNKLEESNREIKSSITYAKRIQSALMPDEQMFNKFFPDSFVLFQPKDIVSGDFFWITKKDNKIYIYKQKHFTKLFPIPYKFTYNYQYLIPLLNDKK